MDVCVVLVAYDVGAAEDDKTGLLSVEVDSFDQLYMKEQPISLPICRVRAVTNPLQSPAN